ncbi:hypothetical protein PFICI_14613 [Pestalotiopsis fici W106-1]|uniref:Uncharacterized protein n=1 Tax=Pestalotiopsis fici (strain W106-1 / CGMCC3.15140) TaxID=1229662 RepID=W3WKH1_PESFW|nr:uncharacterized protein PFICI_14613 [Pestalotiopsis fici W106-1]ETS73667.1 hypothetical protein PFICI_14613 [Pestalotiopsis fici W106-1]
MFNISSFVQRMHDNLSSIKDTVSGLSTESHNTQLDELEQQRDSLLAGLRTIFDQELEEAKAKRQVELDEIKERRRIEDEEREARRKEEDETLQNRNDAEDIARQEKLDGDVKLVDEDTDKKMDEIEEAARALIDGAKLKISALEDQRKEINQLIDEHLQITLPEMPTRKRGRVEQPTEAAVAETQVEAVVESPEPAAEPAVETEEEPAAEEPTTEATENATEAVNEPSEESAAEPVDEPATTDAKSIEEVAPEEPAAETPEPAVEEPAVEEPAVEEPAVEEPAVEEPVVETPTVESVPAEPIEELATENATEPAAEPAESAPEVATEAATESVAEPVVSEPVEEPATESTVNPTAVESVDLAVETAVEPTTAEIPAEPAAEPAAIDSAEQSAANAVADADTVPEPVEESATEAKVEPTIAEPAEEPAAETAMEPSAEPATAEPVDETVIAAEPVTELTTAESVEEPAPEATASDPTEENVPGSVLEPVEQAVIESASTEPVEEATIEAVDEPIAEPVAEVSTTEPVAAEDAAIASSEETVTEPVTESVTEPTAEVTEEPSHQSTEPVVEPATESVNEVAAETIGEAPLESTSKATVQTSEPAAESGQDSATESAIEDKQPVDEIALETAEAAEPSVEATATEVPEATVETETVPVDTPVKAPAAEEPVAEEPVAEEPVAESVEETVTKAVEVPESQESVNASEATQDPTGEPTEAPVATQPVEESVAEASETAKDIEIIETEQVSEVVDSTQLANEPTVSAENVMEASVADAAQPADEKVEIVAEAPAIPAANEVVSEASEEVTAPIETAIETTQSIEPEDTTTEAASEEVQQEKPDTITDVQPAEDIASVPAELDLTTKNATTHPEVDESSSNDEIVEPIAAQEDSAVEPTEGVEEVPKEMVEPVQDTTEELATAPVEAPVEDLAQKSTEIVENPVVEESTQEPVESVQESVEQVIEKPTEIVPEDTSKTPAPETTEEVPQQTVEVIQDVVHEPVEVPAQETTEANQEEATELSVLEAPTSDASISVPVDDTPAEGVTVEQHEHISHDQPTIPESMSAVKIAEEPKESTYTEDVKEIQLSSVPTAPADNVETDTAESTEQSQPSTADTTLDSDDLVQDSTDNSELLEKDAGEEKADVNKTRDTSAKSILDTQEGAKGALESARNEDAKSNIEVVPAINVARIPTDSADGSPFEAKDMPTSESKDMPNFESANKYSNEADTSASGRLEDEQVGTSPRNPVQPGISTLTDTQSDYAGRSEPSREPVTDSPPDAERQSAQAIGDTVEHQEKADSSSAERSNPVELTDKYIPPVVTQTASSSGNTKLGHRPLPPIPADEHQREVSASPLPVENVTVQGSDDLFDDETASSHFSDEEDSEIIDSFPVAHGSNSYMRESSPAQYDGASWGELTDRSTDEPFKAATTFQEEQTPTQSKFDFPRSFGIRAVGGSGHEEDALSVGRARTPSLAPSVLGNNREVSPLVLQPGTPNRGGLAASRHAALTPTRQYEPEVEPEAEADPSQFAPRDVTHVFWHARSPSSLSTRPSSPAPSSLSVDKREPAIQDSWQGSVSGRSRASTQMTDPYGDDEFDPFKYDSAKPAPSDFSSSRRSVLIHPPVMESHRSVSGSHAPAGSHMFQKLRNMFEAPGGNSGEGASSASTIPSQSESITVPSINRKRSSSQLHEARPSIDSSQKSARKTFSRERDDKSSERKPDGLNTHYDNEDYEDEYDDVGPINGSQASGDFRLAWLFVSGWRQRLSTGYDLVEMHKREWDLEDADVEAETDGQSSKRSSWFSF